MILFLGGSGDLGSIAVDELRRRGEEVIAPTSKELNLTNQGAVESFCRELPKKYGVIFAAFVDRRRGETIAEYDTNLSITQNVLTYTRPEWMVFTSSIVVYGESPTLPITESSALVDSGWYGKSKREAEHMVVTWSRDKFPALVARLPGVFGGRSHRNQSFDRILVNGFKSGHISLGDNGHLKRDWLSAWEVTEFFLHYMTRPVKGRVNVVRGDSLTLDEYVAKALEVAPHVRHERLIKIDRHDLPHFVFDPSHFRSSFPDWAFPERQRDIHRLARELVQQLAQTAKP